METAPVVYTIREHFESTLPVWEAYFAGQLNAKADEIESILNTLRTRLAAEVPLPK